MGFRMLWIKHFLSKGADEAARKRGWVGWRVEDGLDEDVWCPFYGLPPPADYVAPAAASVDVAEDRRTAGAAPAAPEQRRRKAPGGRPPEPSADSPALASAAAPVVAPAAAPAAGSTAGSMPSPPPRPKDSDPATAFPSAELLPEGQRFKNGDLVQVCALCVALHILSSHQDSSTCNRTFPSLPAPSAHDEPLYPHLTRTGALAHERRLSGRL